MEKLSICLLTVGTYPVPATSGGAVETLTENLAESFEHTEADCSLHIISCHTDDAVEKSKKYSKTKFHFVSYTEGAMKRYQFIKKVIRKLFGITMVRWNPFFAQALSIINKNKFDIVVVENAVYYANPLKKYSKAEVLLHLHNEYNDIVTKSPDKVINKIDGVLSVSDFVARELKKDFHFQVPVIMLKNVTDVQRFKDESGCQGSKEIRKKFGFSDDDIVCLFVGRLVEDKGVGLLVDAVSQIDDSNIKLLVVGGSAFGDSKITPYVKELHEKADKSNGRIKFSGFVKYEDLPKYYGACDIAVFPSQFEEPAGLVVLEAQSSGKPVIIAESGGMVEYVSEKSAISVKKGASFVDDLKAKIMLLSKSEAMRSEMGKAGQKFTTNYDKCEYFKAFLDAVKQIKKRS